MTYFDKQLSNDVGWLSPPLEKASGFSLRRLIKQYYHANTQRDRCADLINNIVMIDFKQFLLETLAGNLYLEADYRIPPPPLTHNKFIGQQGSFGAYRWLKENEPDRLSQVLSGYRNAVRDGWNSRTFMETYLKEYIYTYNLTQWVDLFIKAAKTDGVPDLDMKFENKRTRTDGRHFSALIQRRRLGGSGAYEVAKQMGWLDTIYKINRECYGNPNENTTSFIQKLILQLPPEFEELYNKRVYPRPDSWWYHFTKTATKDDKEYAKKTRKWRRFPSHRSPLHKPGTKSRRQDNWTHKDYDPIPVEGPPVGQYKQVFPESLE